MLFGKGTTYNEGLPPLDKIVASEAKNELVKTNITHAPENMTAFQIFCQYALKNKHVWYVSLVDACVYLVRFGVLTWLPIYLLQQKGFSKGQMSVAFAIFEWAAILSTLFAGILTDKYFKGRRMPLAIVCMTVILGALFFYWSGTSLLVVTAAAGLIGALIYVPQFLASVQTMEVVPSFAVGSAVGLRGFMSYVVGATMGTALIGKMVDLWGWNAGFAVLLGGAIMCIILCYFAHRGVMELEKQRAIASTQDNDTQEAVKAPA
jgi:OPA family phosphoglycerate-like MFS transporter